MDENLNVHCNKIIIKLSANVVVLVLKFDRLSENTVTGYRLYYWAGKQRGYAHNIEFVLLFF